MSSKSRVVLPALLLVSVLAAVAACSKSADQASDAAGESAAAPAAPSVQGQDNRAGSQLAYEHDVTIWSGGKDIATRIGKVRAACMAERFGACSVLGEDQTAGDSPSGTLKLRAIPAAIEPLVGVAAEGAEVGQRSTSAEDLADAVRDNGLRKARLESQHAKLAEIMARRDIKVEDLIALSHQQAAIEAELQGVEQDAAQQQRRIRTNLLTLHFNAQGVTIAEASATRRAVGNLGGIWDSSLGILITIVGAVLPFALFAGVVWAVVRWVVRRRRRAG
jgi:Domain of unknown function (DUF4349)